MPATFDKTDKISIFKYSSGLLDHCLHDFATEDEIMKLSVADKGKLGKMVEYLYFKFPNNPNPEADFSEAGVELKCTGLKKGKKEQYLIKERLVCNKINYCEDVNVDFEHSHFYTKCFVMLLLFYLYQKHVDNVDLKFLFTVLWKLPAKDLLIIRHDYETIINKIRNGQAHLLSEGDTVYLGACRKGNTGDALKIQPYSDIKAKGRAFSLFKNGKNRVILPNLSNKYRCHHLMLAPSNLLGSLLDVQLKDIHQSKMSHNRHKSNLHLLVCGNDCIHVEIQSHNRKSHSQEHSVFEVLQQGVLLKNADYSFFNHPSTVSIILNNILLRHAIERPVSGMHKCLFLGIPIPIMSRTKVVA